MLGQQDELLPLRDRDVKRTSGVVHPLVAAAPNGLTLSDNALIFRAQGMQVAVVGAQGRVSLHSVKLGRDFGNTVEVLDGLKIGDRVINNPPDSIADGMTVQVGMAAETNSAAQ